MKLTRAVIADGGNQSLRLFRSLQSGGCFAALLVEVHLGGCFAISTLFGRMFCRRGLRWSCLSVDALPPLLAWADALPLWFFFTLADALPLGILVLRRRLCNHSVLAFLFAGFGCSCGVGFFGWVERVVLSVLLAAVCVVVCSRLCLCFFSVSLFLVLCALVLVKLCLAASSLCL